MIEQVAIEDIVLDPRLQMRETMDFTVIDEYAESLADLPPSKIVKGENGELWLTSGWHRYHAHARKGQTTMPCVVREGTFLDALAEAAGENHGHGIRRTNEDKRRAVAALLSEESWKNKSNRMIAEACHVSDQLVAKVREITPTAFSRSQGNSSDSPPRPPARQNNASPPPATRTGADGRERPASPPKPNPAPVLCKTCQHNLSIGRLVRENCEDCKAAMVGGNKPPLQPSRPASSACKDKINLSCPHCGECGIFTHGPAKMPLVFATEQGCPEFQSAWDEWMDYRRERNLTMTVTTLQKQIAFLDSLGVEAAIESINNSILCGWQGLFAPNKGGKKKESWSAVEKEMYDWAKKRDEEDSKNDQI